MFKMKKRKMNKAQLSEELGLTRGAISYWFRNDIEVKINRGYYEALSNCLDISIDWLVEGVGPMDAVLVKDGQDALILNLISPQPEKVKKSLIYFLKNWVK